MAGKITFKVGDVRRIYEHSKAAVEHSASYEHLFDAKYHKGGVILCKDGKPYSKNSKEFNFPDDDNIDCKLIPACLDLVGDHGIYLMSNGIPRQVIEEGKQNGAVVYSKESNPINSDDWDEAKNCIFGCDDGSIPLPLSMFEEIMKLADDATFQISLTATSVKVILPKIPAKQVKIKNGMKVQFSKPVKFKSGFEASLFQIEDEKQGVLLSLDAGHRCKIDLKNLRDYIRNGTAQII